MNSKKTVKKKRKTVKEKSMSLVRDSKKHFTKARIVFIYEHW